MKLDLLAIGVHPDDVELGCSGTIINEIKNGKKVGVLDLTQGELGSRGTIETRYEEAAKAAMIMGIHVRENLKMRDGFFKNDEEHQSQMNAADSHLFNSVFICVHLWFNFLPWTPTSARPFTKRALRS